MAKKNGMIAGLFAVDPDNFDRERVDRIKAEKYIIYGELPHWMSMREAKKRGMTEDDIHEHNCKCSEIREAASNDMPSELLMAYSLYGAPREGYEPELVEELIRRFEDDAHLGKAYMDIQREALDAQIRTPERMKAYKQSIGKEAKFMDKVMRQAAREL